MNKKIKITIIASILALICILTLNYAQACTCDKGTVTYDDCSGPGSPLCETEYGNYNGRCSCVPDCIDGDGYCSSGYQYYGDDLIECQEDTFYNPSDCCAEGTKHLADCNRDGTCDIDLKTNNDYCGSCTNVCGDNEKCVDGSCETVYSCGNGIIEPENPAVEEQCDGNTTCNPYNVLGGCEYCSDCRYLRLDMEYCGDGKITGLEECDDSSKAASNPYNHNGVECDAYNITGGCTFCSETCKNTALPKLTCGDGICTAANETTATCFQDCDDAVGWNTSDPNWGMSEGRLSTNGNGVIYSAPFDIKRNVYYNLSAVITGMTDTCKVTMSLDSKCTSGQDFLYKECGISSPAITNDSASSVIFILDTAGTNANAVNHSYFRDARVKITSECTSGSVYISNISLKENLSGIIYGAIPASVQTTGCCPSQYCWDGEKCVNSTAFMMNSSKMPVWNDAMIIYHWDHNHVNTTNQSQTSGFRCVVPDNRTGKAEWAVSSIKYDWDYEQSGYCARESDCFVSAVFEAKNGVDVLKNYSKGCVRDLDIVSDNQILGKGNHLCYNGQWTTKSYMIATLLQNISVTDGRPYIMQCYDNNSLNYNQELGADKILSSCVITMQGATNERVITGVILKEGSPDDKLAFLTELQGNYEGMFDASASDVKISEPRCYSKEASTISGTNFAKCFDGVAHMYVVYNKKYDYFLVSDVSIESSLKEPNFLQNIIGFFKSLFGSRSRAIDPYTAIDHTTSYDRMYILRNDTLNVTAMEETKYDEETMQKMTILYVKFTGSNETNNPMHMQTLSKKINDTMKESYLDDPIISYNQTATSQEIIIKTQVRTDTWRSIVTILRDRK